MKRYFDLSRLSGCTGVFAGPDVQVVYTGTGFHTEPAKYRDTDLVRKLAGENDLHFWFNDEPVELPFYTVPKTELGGYDSRGGFFAGCPDFSLRAGETVCYIDADRRCWRIDSARSLMTMGSSWREKLVPSDAIEIFDSFEQACERYSIHRPVHEEELRTLLGRAVSS